MCPSRDESRCGSHDEQVHYETHSVILLHHADASLLIVHELPLGVDFL